MFDVVRARIKQGYRTLSFPKGPSPQLPASFRGCPVIGCGGEECARSCIASCPTSALTAGDTARDGTIQLDLGRCIFCGKCAGGCERGGIKFSTEFSLASSTREGLSVGSKNTRPSVTRLDDKRLKLFGKSLRLRQVSAGGCNACEADTNVLTTVAWDLRRFGIDFVASPRHADGLLVTGPVTKNMIHALHNTYEAIAGPKLVIAVGSCAVSGGLFKTHEETLDGVNQLLPVDLHIPGCPPHPLTILDGLLRLLGKI
jgi:Ni,Fe-hydrogenase III small subunit